MNLELVYIKPRSRKYLLTEKGLSFLSEELERGNSYIQLAKIFDINPDTLANLAKENNIHKDNRRKYTINEHYFDIIDSKEKAYWLGFLAADGYVDQNRGIIDISLQEEDKSHIQRFLKAIGSNKMPKERHSYFNNKDHKCYGVVVNSKIMTQRLLHYGLYANKSLTLSRPYSETIPRCWIKYWILGYFDGDGCLSIWNSKGSVRYKMGFLGTKDVIDFIQEFFGTNKTVRLAHNCKATYQFTYTETLTKQCLDYFYRDLDVLEFCLQRKYQKYKQYIGD